MRRNLFTICFLVILSFLAACATLPPAAEPVPDADLSALVVETEATITAPPATGTPTTSPPTAVPTETPQPPTETPLPTSTPYVVQAGDTIAVIAETFGTTINAIAQANGLLDPSLITIGQELFIPTGASATPPSAAQPAPETSAVPESSTPDPAPSAVEESSAATPTPDSTPGITPRNTAEVKATAAPGPVLLNVDGAVACPTSEVPIPAGAVEVGRSAVCNLPIVSYQISEGDIPLILVGGIHGGYEWNTIQLAYEMLRYLNGYPGLIPPSLAVYLIPNANPDGLYAVSGKVGDFAAADLAENTVPGRFNGRDVDLNRNWDCNWIPTATWRDNPISGGEYPFSEPENQALRDYILAIQPAAVLFWHSAANGVFASGCDAIDPLSKEMAVVYSRASGYPVYDTFAFYDVTGDAGDWLATYQGIPSLSVELTNHTYLDWDMNLAGVTALMNHLATD